MGNYCCHDDGPLPPPELKLKRKASLIDPIVKKQYQGTISQVLNKALNKFKEDKKVSNIHLIAQIGRGGQGDVFLVELSIEDKYGDIVTKQYAMKRVSKSKLSLQRTKKALILENQLLSSHQSNFLARIQYAFQDTAYLYYVMEVARGGDLYGYIYGPNLQSQSKSSVFSELGESGIKFIIAGIVLGLQYLNNDNIIYRDLKPQNILIYEDGYPSLADFGIVHRKLQNQLCYDKKGTVLYFSPEMALKRGYDKGHDLWTLGILIFELVFKQIPFSQQLINSSRFSNLIRSWEQSPKFPNKPASDQVLDLMKKLLKINPKQRIGYESIQEIKGHQFFKDFDWEKYHNKQIESPLVGIVASFQSKFKPLTQDVEQGDIYRQERIPFTFVRDELTRSDSFDKSDSNSDEGSL